MKIAWDSDTDTIHAYFSRIHERTCESANSQALKCCLSKLLRSANRHLSRFDLAARRYHRALELGQKGVMAFERDTMWALLYEAADTVYLVFQLLDPDQLNLTSSSDGAGIAGEDAPFVREILDAMEKICAKVLELSVIYDIPLDFKKALDEREGITYETHAHWRDLIPGSLEKSFFAYFSQAKEGVLQRLNQVPRFWGQQSIKQAIFNTPRPALRELLLRLISTPFKQPSLAEKIEKERVISPPRHRDLAEEALVWQAHAQNLNTPCDSQN